MDIEQPPESILETVRVAVAAMRDAGVPYMLGGSFAAWARGGPLPQKDLDLMVKPQDAERALEALAAAGMRTGQPPEEWLLKAWHGDVMVDVIFHPSGLDITDEVLARADTISVLAIATPVMALEDMLATKLMSLNEHSLDYRSVLAIARALREQIDWDALIARTGESPFAKAFFTLVRELGIAPAGDETEPRPLRQPGSRVRVVR
ncbi:MAG: nucleotidyltransferase [Solirubrobacterales bacterium]|nr:nucleotidyltransferase [Solirubrobacterales bacterium]